MDTWNMFFGWIEEIFHVSIAMCRYIYVLYNAGDMPAYMLADFSEKGCLKYQLLLCAGSIATNPILGDFEGIFNVPIATCG